MTRDFYNGLGELEPGCGFTGAVLAGSTVHCNIHLGELSDLDINYSGDVGLMLQADDVAGCLLDNGIFQAVDVIRKDTASARTLTVVGEVARTFADKELIGDAITRCLSAHTVVLRDPVCVDAVKQTMAPPSSSPGSSMTPRASTTQADPGTPKANALILAALVVGGLIYLSENDKKR